MSAINPLDRARRLAAAPRQRRFYQAAEMRPEGGSFALHLDGKRALTPGRRPLSVPDPAVAEVIAGEWAGQGETIDPASMPVTRLANTAIDGVAERLEAVREDVLAYVGTDLSVEAKATEGTPEVLSYLRDGSFEYALVSNSSLQRLSACLTAAALNGYFPSDQIFSAHDSLPAARPKPLPDIYLHAVSYLEAEVSDCVAVEDSISGVKAAVAAGIGQIIGYVGGTHISDDERRSRADALQLVGAQQVIERMPDLISLLCSA